MYLGQFCVGYACVLEIEFCGKYHAIKTKEDKQLVQGETYT